MTGNQYDDLIDALQRVVSDVLDYDRVNNLAPNPGRRYCWDSIENAVDVLRTCGRDVSAFEKL